MRNFIRTVIAASLLAALPLVAGAGVFVSVNFGPPALPVYVQPAMPGPGYLWIPGYWAWGGGGYYWVPGTWALAPEVGLLWTPGYWGWMEGAYVWHGGYWGPHVGFYGGINYGFGYSGVGFHGGYWQEGRYFANPAAAHEFPANHVSFNGGAGGVVARPTAGEMIAARDHHLGFTPLQLQHEQMASHNEALRAAVNNGKPPITATARPAEFGAHPAIAAHAPAMAAHTPALAAHTPATAAHTATPQTHTPAPPQHAPQGQYAHNGYASAGQYPRGGGHPAPVQYPRAGAGAAQGGQYPRSAPVYSQGHAAGGHPAGGHAAGGGGRQGGTEHQGGGRAEEHGRGG